MINICIKHKISILIIFLFCFFKALSAWAVFPSPELLKELEKRLLEKSDCFPNCAEIEEMRLSVYPEKLSIILSVHSALETAIPLPGSKISWSPDEVFINDNISKGLMRLTDGNLWILIPKGIHQISLRGKTPLADRFDIPLLLKPQTTIITAEGWEIQGIHPDGSTEAGLQLTRKEQAETSGFKNTSISPFFHLERKILLGLKWQIQSTVKRISPSATSATISVPILKGESIITPGIIVKNKEVIITMGPGQSLKKWKATLEFTDQIELKAQQGLPFTETWILDADTIWHCEFAGIPPVHHQDTSGERKPEWMPLPGESLSISVSKPKALAGQIKTIDKAWLKWSPGERFQKGSLELQIRTSQGGQHIIGLPENAKVQEITIDGNVAAFSQENKGLAIQLDPGTHKVNLNWHENNKSFPLTLSPLVNIGEKAVNAHVEFNMPSERWILWTEGPVLGPAVLWWSYVIVIIFAGMALGKIRLTPLKSRHWILLGLGLTQIHPVSAVIVVGWFFALGLRKNKPLPAHWFSFNLMQFGLILWTLAALIVFYLSIQRGLLGIPDMQISGNGSSNFYLHWTKDRTGSFMPSAWVISVPIFVYRFLMLAWAFWLVLALLKWIKWVWGCFSSEEIWKKALWRKKQNEVLSA